MFLSSLISRYDADGELLVDLHQTGGPMLRRLDWLRDQLASTDNRWLINRLFEDHRPLLTDTSRLLQTLDTATVERLTRHAPKDWEGLQRLHDSLLNQQQPARAHLDPKLSFGPPPIPSAPYFEAILNVGELNHEGRLMNHCVATRASSSQLSNRSLFSS